MFSQLQGRPAALYVGFALDAPTSGEQQLSPRLPALEKFIARADRHHAPVCDNVSFADWAADTGALALPVAALCRLADSGEVADGWWLRADPVRLEPAGDTLRLLMPAPSGSGAHEQALVEALALELGDDGWQLDAPVPGRWYLRAPSALDCQTTPTECVAGGDIFPHLPRGADARRLRALMNDIQMLAHQCNETLGRERLAQTSINAVWVWGQGRWPPPTVAQPRPLPMAWSDDAYLRGLWQWRNGRCQSPHTGEQCLDAMPEGGFVAAPVLDHSVAALKTLETLWLQPLLKAVADGRLTSLSLVTAARCELRLSRRGLRRFWRRPRALSHLHPLRGPAAK